MTASWCYMHLIKYRFKNIEAQVDTSHINSNLDLELLGRYELTVQCTNAFNRILPMPRSTKYSPLFSLQLQSLCLIYCAFQCYNVIIWWKQTISIKTCNKWVMQFYQPSHHFMYEYIRAQLSHYTVVKHPQSLSFLNTTDQDCNINKRQVKLCITFLNHYVCIQETER